MTVRHHTLLYKVSLCFLQRRCDTTTVPFPTYVCVLQRHCGSTTIPFPMYAYNVCAFTSDAATLQHYDSPVSYVRMSIIRYLCSPATLRQSLVLRMHMMSVISAATLWQCLNPSRMYVFLYVYYKVCVFSCTTTTLSQFRILCMHMMSVTVLSLVPLRQSLTLRPICLHMLESDTNYVLYYVLKVIII